MQISNVKTIFTNCQKSRPLTAGYMAAFLRQIKIRVLTLTSRKSNEKIKIYGASDYQDAPEPAGRQESGGDLP
jgi:hypothetical protein